MNPWTLRAPDRESPSILTEALVESDWERGKARRAQQIRSSSWLLGRETAEALCDIYALEDDIEEEKKEKSETGEKKEEELTEAQKAAMWRTIRRLHVGLGHASKPDLVRILRHGGASAAALRMARRLTCDVCDAHRKPIPARPAATPKHIMPLAEIAIDVKALPYYIGAKVKTRKALNILDLGSRFQMVVPFPEGVEGQTEEETGKLLRLLYVKSWLAIFGPPEVVYFDRSGTNLSDAMREGLSFDGSLGKD